MRKTALLIIMCIATLLAAAQNGWLYKDSVALLLSGEEYLGNSFDNPATLKIVLGSDEGRKMALIGIEGEITFLSFRERQQYIVANFGGESSKWKIEMLRGENFLKYVSVLDASRFIDKLCECDFFTITLPLAIYGNTTFYFSTGGYPLDW